MQKLRRLWPWCCKFLLMATLGGPLAMAEKDQERIASVLDQFHKAASEHDFQKYFSLLSADAVFIGTDASERWTRTQFQAYVKPLFDKGHGWTYVPRNRHIQLDPTAQVAWFDEIVDNSKYGVCRGTGVLIKDKKSWKISQYHLTIPVPNDMVIPLVQLIQGHEKKTAK